MSIPITCPQCGAHRQIHSRFSGRLVRCPHCEAEVLVPGELKDDSSWGETPLPDDVLDAPSVAAVPTADFSADLDAKRDSAVPDAGDERTSDEDAGGQEVMEVEPEIVGDMGAGQPQIHFAGDPVFDSPDHHHHATEMPSLPPSLLPEEDDDAPPARVKRKEDELDMTPMVDVTFLLLIFFMVTASFSLQKSVEMPRQRNELPSSQQEEDEEEVDMVTVQIDEYGSFLVLAVDWERETPGKQNLITALREAINEVSGGVKLAIEVHEDAKLKYLVDCMDAGAICNYAEIQVTQVDGFD